MLVSLGYGSRKCSECGYIKHDLIFSDRIYYFNACDLKAAINIRRKGMESMEQLKIVGIDIHKYTPTEIGLIPERPNLFIEIGNFLLKL
jgi:hypothetical protein